MPVGVDEYENMRVEHLLKQAGLESSRFSHFRVTAFKQLTREVMLLIPRVYAVFDCLSGP